jgi:hypothetical protein
MMSFKGDDVSVMATTTKAAGAGDHVGIRLGCV